MSELEEKLSALMSNPQLMQQVAALAQSMGQPESSETQPPSPPPIDPGMVQMLSRAVSQSGADSNQQALLQALSPFVSADRIRKLERAMRAAKLAGTASLFLNSGGLQLFSGR